MKIIKQANLNQHRYAWTNSKDAKMGKYEHKLKVIL